MSFKIGADPEFFLYDTKNSQFISAFGILPDEAKKGSPLDIGDGINVLVDGQAVEYNIPPCDTAEDFLEVNKLAISKLRKMIDKQYAFAFCSAASFKRDYYKSLPFKQREVGCDPFFNANPRHRVSVAEHEGSLRRYQESHIKFAGGHIHLGWGSGFDVTDVDHISDCEFVVKGMADVVTAVNIDSMKLSYFSSVYSRSWNTSTSYVKIPNPYTSSYDYRPKPYGVELRGFNNTWLCTDTGILTVANVVLKGVEHMYATGAPVPYPRLPPFSKGTRLEDKKPARGLPRPQPVTSTVDVKDNF